jgi:hypothetical protein
MSDLRVEGLKVGQRYRVIFHVPGFKLPRQMVAEYMDQKDNVSLFFNLRPVAGTQELNVEWVKQMWETAQPIMTPMIYRGETRVF